MITLNDIAEIAGISKPSALKMALRHDWPMRQQVVNKKRINTYSITRDDVKKSIVQTAEQKQKKRLAGLRTAKALPKLSTEPELMTIEQIRKIINETMDRNENYQLVRRVFESSGLESKSILIKKRWTLHYNVSVRQIVDARS